MNIKTGVICIVSVTVVFIISFIIFGDSLKEKFFPSLESCDDDGEVCVRFCCFEPFVCDEKINNDSFNISARLESKEFLDANYKVLKGKPCASMYEEDDWGLMRVRYFEYFVVDNCGVISVHYRTDVFMIFTTLLMIPATIVLQLMERMLDFSFALKKRSVKFNSFILIVSAKCVW